VMSEWIEGPAAVLEAWMMGQAGGGAIADVLYGKVNPSGRLAETFPLRLVDTPTYINYPGGNGVVRYGEGIFIGYRYYDAKQVPVLFPFGYGLCYTSFTFTNLKVSAQTFKDVDGVNVSVDVTNTGKLTGKEVVQVYVHDHMARLVRPPKELKGFAKVELQPGETKTVTIPLDFRAFAYYHPGYKQWITEDGKFDILVGASATDIRDVQTVQLQSTLELPSLLNRYSTLREWLEDEQGKAVLMPMLQQMTSLGQEIFGSEGSEDIGMDVSGFMMDMPFIDRLYFFSGNLPTTPEEVVDGLLAQVHGKER
jgi:beta-glucosidase